MEIPFSTGSGYSIKELITMLAVQANLQGIDHRTLIEEFLIKRIDEARKRGLSDQQIARALGYTVDYIRELKAKPTPSQIPIEELLRILVHGLHENQPLTERQAAARLEKFYQDRGEKVPPEITAQKLLQEGVAKGLFTTSTHGGGTHYLRTAAHFQWQQPATMAQKGAKAFRCNSIWHAMRASGVETKTIHLGPLGVNYLLNNVVNDNDPDPKHPNAPCGLRLLCNTLNKALERSNDRCKQKGLPVPSVATIGTLLTLSQPMTVEVGDSRLKQLGWAISQYVAGASHICPARYMLDATGLRACMRQWPEIIKAFHDELNKAELVSTAETVKHPYTISLGYAKL